MKQFYSLRELAEADWFPINSVPTIRLLIESKKLPALNVGQGKKYKKLMVMFDDAFNYIKSQTFVLDSFYMN